jgi:hypothetical protein
MAIKPNISGPKKIDLTIGPHVSPAIKVKTGFDAGTNSGAGTIAKQIGTGDNAKDSFVWMTLRSCFWIAGLISAGLFFTYFVSFFVKGCVPENTIVDSLKNLWAIFTPIITLALGYAFGKRDAKS